MVVDAAADFVSLVQPSATAFRPALSLFPTVHFFPAPVFELSVLICGMSTLEPIGGHAASYYRSRADKTVPPSGGVPATTA